VTSKLLIKNGTVITMNDDNDILDSTDVLIENDTIKSVSPAITEPGDD